MEKKMKTKSAIAKYVDDSTRCQQRTPSGRRCKLPVEAPGKLLCFAHTRELLKADTLNLKTALLTDHQGFQTAQGINHSLGNLYKLLAANYISPRRAAVLAYINSLQLRTLPAIDADQAAGITDPTAAPEPQPACDSADIESNADTEAESDSLESDALESDSPAPNAEHSVATSNASLVRDPAPPTPQPSYWSTQPDPTKKPS